MSDNKPASIASFQLDHDTHDVGFYVSKATKLKGVTVYTYDLRFKLPNSGDYLSYPAIHSIEHLLAVALRNTDYADEVLYFGPMGCRTGFYMLTLDIPKDDARTLLLDAIKTCLTYKELPGNSRKECGNYLEHDLSAAHKELDAYLKALKN